MLLKFFSLLFYWKTKKATLFEMGETKENMLLCVFCSLFCECYAKKKNVSWSCKLRRRPEMWLKKTWIGFGESVTNISKH